MNNPRLAGRYAKSLVDIAQERNELETVYRDMQFLQAICRSNRDFVNVLKSPVIKGDTKLSIVKAVVNGRVSELTMAFISLLTRKGRESNLPEIVQGFLTQYNEIKGIHRVRLTTAAPVSEEVQTAIVAKVNREAGYEKVELETKVDESLIGGFVLEFHNKLVDASISRDLKDIRKQFLQNVYVPNIR